MRPMTDFAVDAVLFIFCCVGLVGLIVIIAHAITRKDWE